MHTHTFFFTALNGPWGFACSDMWDDLDVRNDWWSAVAKIHGTSFRLLRTIRIVWRINMGGCLSSDFRIVKFQDEWQGHRGLSKGTNSTLWGVLRSSATKGFSIWYCRISSYLRTETPVPRMTADPDIFGLSDQSTGCQRDDWKNHKEMCRRIDNHTGLLDDRERDANRWIFATTVHSPESCLLGDLLL